MVTEILVAPTIYPIPNSPPWLFGMINLRGNILPVIELTHILSTSHKTSAGQFVLVVDKGSEALAVNIDALPKSLNDPISVAEIGKMNILSEQFLKPGVQASNTHWIELDIKQLLLHMKQNEDSGQENSTLLEQR